MFGLLNIDKPQDWSSRDVVNNVSRLVGRKVKIGHAGTLDPLATGVLVVCLGKATKLVPFIHDYLKTYEGTFLIGYHSETDDTEGELVPVSVPPDFDSERIRALLPEFVGQIRQVPPAYSAIRINGERAYQAARRGEDVEIPVRDVYVERLELVELTSQSMTLSMTCGTGTYVRSIGRDLARRAGTDAAMSQLVRTSIGPFRLEDAVTLDQLTRNNIGNYLLPPLAALGHLSSYQVTTAEAERLRFGQRLEFEPSRLAGSGDREDLAIVLEDQQLVAVARLQQGCVAPQIVFPLSE